MIPTSFALKTAIGVGAGLAISTGHSVIEFAKVLGEKLAKPDVPQITSTASSETDNLAATIQPLKDFFSSIGVNFADVAKVDAHSAEPLVLQTEQLEPWQKTSLATWLDDNPDFLDRVKQAIAD